MNGAVQMWASATESPPTNQFVETVRSLPIEIGQFAPSVKFANPAVTKLIVLALWLNMILPLKSWPAYVKSIYDNVFMSGEQISIA